MKIKRTYKTTSLKFGEVETVNEAKAREVFGQTLVRCRDNAEYEYDADSAMKRLLNGDVVSTFFSDFQLIEA